MTVKLAKKTETVYVARCQWVCGQDVNGKDIVPFGLLWERGSYDEAAGIVDRNAVKTYKAPDGETTRLYHTWLEQVTRYDDNTEEALVIREYNRPEMKRFAVTLTRDGTTERWGSFAWGTTHEDAYNSVAEQFERDTLWDGWSFTVADEPTEV